MTVRVRLRLVRPLPDQADSVVTCRVAVPGTVAWNQVNSVSVGFLHVGKEGRGGQGICVCFGREKEHATRTYFLQPYS